MINRTPIYTKSFRKNLTLEVINPDTIKAEKVIPSPTKKDIVLQDFINTIPKSTADADDYLHYMFTFIFSQNDHCMAVTREQKYNIRYLCSNESSFFGKNVTRGQIKLWYVIYHMKHNKAPENFKTLTDWILYEKYYQGDPITDEVTSFKKDLLSSESYFDSIHQLNNSVVLGNKGYFNSSFSKTSLFPAVVKQDRYTGKEGYRNLLFDNMVDPAKLAALKKKFNF